MIAVFPYTPALPLLNHRRRHDRRYLYCSRRHTPVIYVRDAQPPPPPDGDPLTALSRLLFRRSLPPEPLIAAVRHSWTTAWRLMMRQLAPSDRSGSYSRPPSSFFHPRQSPPLHRSLHLYVGLACPWAHRTLIVRALKGLELVIPVSVASPGINGAWEFHTERQQGRNQEAAEVDGGVVPGPDQANGRRTLREVYGLRSGGYEGRSTVPMLWDLVRRDVVSNESLDIIKFFNEGMNDVAGNPTLDLYPLEGREEIDGWIDIIYPNVNNGVYRCGFAQSQKAYDKAIEGLFETLDVLEAHLETTRYLCGDQLSLVDVCLFTTLIRFDLVYNSLFKCTRKKLIQYPNLHAYTRDIYQIPKVAGTCKFEAIMDGCYRILFPLNPGGILAAMPTGFEHAALFASHSREQLFSKGENTMLTAQRGTIRSM